MKALVIGATGATGKDLVNKLLNDKVFDEVHIFVRKRAEIQNEKLKTHVVNFEKPEEWKHLVKGDAAFSCLGTTLKDAGSKDAQRKVDFDFQYNFAKAARENGVENYILVSANGANADSNVFYYQLKGELEREIKKLNFAKTTIFQPGMLARKGTNRPVENIGVKVIEFANKFGIFKSQKPMPTETLAKAMINASKQNSNHYSVFKLDEIFKIADKK